MSLINEALKRAQEAQSKETPPPLVGAPLHATASTKSAWPWIAVALVLITFAVVAGGLFFFRASKSSPARIVVADAPPAKSTTPPDNFVVEQTKATIVTNIHAPPPSAISVEATNAVSSAVVAPPAATNPPLASAEPAPPKPQFRLQGIFYRPDRPSAMINGKTVYIGERIGEARVVAINQESATLVVAGQTNVLNLP